MPRFSKRLLRGLDERSDDAIRSRKLGMDCFAPLAMTLYAGGAHPWRARSMSLGTILIIILIILLLGSFSRRFGGHGYGLGHSGTGLIGVILIVLLILLLLGKL